MNDNKIYPIVLMENNSIAAGATEYAAKIIDMYALHPNGNFSMQIELDADGTTGTATVHYECTNIEASSDADRFIKPSGADIFTAFFKTDGEGADGRDIRDFNVETCYQLRIGVTAAGGPVKIKRLIIAVQ